MTSAKLVQDEILRFLGTKEPEVLCITGEWGIGKTFTWQTIFARGKQSKGLALDWYSYASLFGVTSLDGLKWTLVENVEYVGTDHLEPLHKRTVGAVTKILRGAGKSRETISNLPHVGKLVKSAGPLFFSTVRNQYVCIDDLERRGPQLPVGDVLGLISFLKEQRKCKVVLLLNEGELGEGANEFQRYSEKVIDVTLRFVPTPLESAAVALPANDAVSNLVRENCIKLGVSNIRVIKKIERLVRNIQPLVADYDQDVLHHAAHTLTLFGWSKFQPRSAPPMKVINARKDFTDRTVSKLPEYADANALLDSYGFRYFDEFDTILLTGIENGFFDKNEVTKNAARLDERRKAEKKLGSFEEAWRLYHETFADNEKELLERLETTFRSSVGSISQINLNGTVKLFKELGCAERAKRLIEHYVQNRNEGDEFWDMGEYPFGSDVKDPDVLRAFEEKLQSLKPISVNPIEFLRRKARSHSWDVRELALMAALPVEEYYRIFKSDLGEDRTRIVKAALNFGVVSGASSQMLEVTRKATEALRRIGQESPLNARRVAQLGVSIEKSRE